MAAPPKDTIYVYWRATLLVTKGHTVKILNLWRTCTLSAPKYAEKAQKRCCVLCVWLYLLPSSFKRWPKGHYFIGLRCWLPHNVQKSPLFQTNIKAGFRMRHYPHDTHIHKHTHTHTHTCKICAQKTVMCGSVFCVGMPVSSRASTSYVASLSCQRLWQAGGNTQKKPRLCPPSMFKTVTLAMKECFQSNQVSVWAQAGVQYRNMLNVLAKHHWVGEEVGEDMRGLTRIVWKPSVYICVCVCVCVCVVHTLLINICTVTHCTCSCVFDPSLCGYFFASLFVHTVCQCMWGHWSQSRTWVCLCVCVCVCVCVCSAYS